MDQYKGQDHQSVLVLFLLLSLQMSWVEGKASNLLSYDISYILSN